MIQVGKDDVTVALQIQYYQWVVDDSNHSTRRMCLEKVENIFSFLVSYTEKHYPLLYLLYTEASAEVLKVLTVNETGAAGVTPTAHARASAADHDSVK